MRYCKTFVKVIFGAFIAGGYSPTVSAHKLIVDFKEGTVGACIHVKDLNDCIAQFVSFADGFDRISGGVSRVGEPKDNLFVKYAIEGFLNGIRQRKEWVDIGIDVEVPRMEDRYVVILRNGIIPSDQSKCLLDGVQCGKPSLEIVFDNVTCELDYLNRDFLKYVILIGHTSSAKISFTENAFNLLSKSKVCKGLHFVDLGPAQQYSSEPNRKNIRENTENKDIFKNQDADGAFNLAEKERLAQIEDDSKVAEQLQAKYDAEIFGSGLPAQEDFGKSNPEGIGVNGDDNIINEPYEIPNIKEEHNFAENDYTENKSQVKIAVKNGVERQKSKIEKYVDRNGLAGAVSNFRRDIQEISSNREDRLAKL